ncbi:MAG: glycosyltransferase [Clostridia bacterium]|nr:glycosyltransferase [Clostridia bacterium]
MIDIITCFCDKDFNLIDRFINETKKLSFDFRLTFVDDRTDKNLDLSEKLSEYNYLIPPKKQGLFEARRFGFENTNNDFIWYVDIDDDLFDFKLNYLPTDDVVLYNFYLNETTKNKISKQEFYPKDRLYIIDLERESQLEYADNFLLRTALWNKIFNRKTLKKCYDSIPTLDNFFVYEDLYILKHFIYFAKNYRTSTQCIYQWNASTLYELKDNLDYLEKFKNYCVNEKVKAKLQKTLDLLYIDKASKETSN